MNFEPLMQSVVDSLRFFELGQPEVIDDDAALEMIESIAARLKELGPAERTAFLDFLSRAAEQAVSTDERQFLQSVPLALGLDAV